jgi:type I restriction enzyme S subunit
MKTTAPNSENLEVRSEKRDQKSSFSLPSSHFSLHPPALVPKLRFPEFREAEGWESGKVDDLVDTVTPPKKLPTALYASSGAFPIIDQSQSDICGWTDDNEALIRESLPLIVFGDHTCILKLIAKPFAQGADGIKILKTGPKLGTPYLYQFISYRPVTTEEYKRHYAILKEKIVFFPEFKSGEQQKIAECLSSVDELMAAQARKVDALKTHKKGLMQQLFPREGETQPRLRFPEFQNAGQWQILPLAALADKIMVGIASAATHAYRETGVPMLRNQNIKEGKIDDSSLLYIDPTYEAAHKNKRLRAGDVITVRTGYPGLSAVVPERYNNAQCFTSLITRPKKAVLDANYLCAFVNSEIGKRFILGAEAGGAQKNVNAGSLEALPVYLPETPEQHRIASCLSSLDALITAETQKLESLKTHKRGLMQQLFPSPEEATS